MGILDNLFHRKDSPQAVSKPDLNPAVPAPPPGPQEKKQSINSRREAEDKEKQWVDLNLQIVEGMKTGDWQLLARAYFSLALIRKNESRTDYFELLEESCRCQLKGFRDAGDSEVRIAADKASPCPKCLALDGRVLTVKEALQRMPIPIKDCDNEEGYCRCRYVAVIERPQ